MSQAIFPVFCLVECCHAPFLGFHGAPFWPSSVSRRHVVPSKTKDVVTCSPLPPTDCIFDDPGSRFHFHGVLMAMFHNKSSVCLHFRCMLEFMSLASCFLLHTLHGVDAQLKPRVLENALQIQPPSFVRALLELPRSSVILSVSLPMQVPLSLLTSHAASARTVLLCVSSARKPPLNCVRWNRSNNAVATPTRVGLIRCETVRPNENFYLMGSLSRPQNVLDPCHFPLTSRKRLLSRTTLQPKKL
jgi:hypothetical protein